MWFFCIPQIVLGKTKNTSIIPENCRRGKNPKKIMVRLSPIFRIFRIFPNLSFEPQSEDKMVPVRNYLSNGTWHTSLLPYFPYTTFHSMRLSAQWRACSFSHYPETFHTMTSLLIMEFNADICELHHYRRISYHFHPSPHQTHFKQSTI